MTYAKLLVMMPEKKPTMIPGLAQLAKAMGKPIRKKKGGRQTPRNGTTNINVTRWNTAILDMVRHELRTPSTQ